MCECVYETIVSECECVFLSLQEERKCLEQNYSELRRPDSKVYIIHAYTRRKSDCLGCAVLLCLVVCLTLLLPSFLLIKT